MSKFLPTRKSLLSRLKNWDDQASWKDFFDTYWRLVYNTARKAGLNNEEAEDVVQDTVISVCKNIPDFKYDPKKCSFKTWLLKLVQWRIVDRYRKRLPVLEKDVEEPNWAIENIQDESHSSLERIWDEEWESYVIERTLAGIKGRVNPKHYQIFQLIYVRKTPVAQVAKQLKVKRTWIYLVKHRLSKMFEQELQNHKSGSWPGCEQEQS